MASPYPRATLIYRTNSVETPPHSIGFLSETAEHLSSGAPIATTIKNAIQTLDDAGIDRVEYLELRDPDTLEPLESLGKPGRLLAAIHIGKTRLIDNVSVAPAH